MRTTWNFFTAGQIIFGSGAVRQLGGLLAKRKLHRAFVITDKQLVAAEIAPKVLHSLTEASLSTHLFDEGAAEPSIEVAVKAAEWAKAFQPDCIVGLGGGSNMDLAKIVAVLVTHGGFHLKLFYIWQFFRAGDPLGGGSPKSWKGEGKYLAVGVCEHSHTKKK